MKLLKPDLCVDRLPEIDIGFWYNKGIRCILIDLDNTVALWKHPVFTDEAGDFIARARQTGITVVLFSNAPERRVREAAWNAGISYYAYTRKPFPYRYHKAIADLSLSKTEVMAIGDQVFTDVLGGNLAGCTTVLTSPISEREYSATRVMRLMERLLTGRKLVFQEPGRQPAAMIFSRKR